MLHKLKLAVKEKTGGLDVTQDTEFEDAHRQYQTVVSQLHRLQHAVSDFRMRVMETAQAAAAITTTTHTMFASGGAEGAKHAARALVNALQQTHDPWTEPKTMQLKTTLHNIDHGPLAKIQQLQHICNDIDAAVKDRETKRRDYDYYRTKVKNILRKKEKQERLAGKEESAKDMGARVANERKEQDACSAYTTSNTMVKRQLTFIYAQRKNIMGPILKDYLLASAEFFDKFGGITLQVPDGTFRYLHEVPLDSDIDYVEREVEQQHSSEDSAAGGGAAGEKEPITNDESETYGVADDVPKDTNGAAEEVPNETQDEEIQEAEQEAANAEAEADKKKAAAEQEAAAAKRKAGEEAAEAAAAAEKQAAEEENARRKADEEAAAARRQAQEAAVAAAAAEQKQAVEEEAASAAQEKEIADRQQQERKEAMDAEQNRQNEVSAEALTSGVEGSKGNLAAAALAAVENEDEDGAPREGNADPQEDDQPLEYSI